MAEMTAADRKQVLEKDMNSEAREVVQKMQLLEATVNSQDLLSTYKQAVYLRTLAEDKARYGQDAMDQALKVLDRKIRWGEQMLVIARSFDESMIEELAQRRDGMGGAFTKTHLEILATVTSKQIRRQVISLWAKESLKTDAFAELVRSRTSSESAEEGGEEGGEEVELTAADVKKTPSRMVKSTIGSVEKAAKAIKEVTSVNWRKFSGKDLELVKKLSETLDELSEMVESAMARFPVEEIEGAIESEASSPEATLGASRTAAKPTAAKPGKATKAAAVKTDEPPDPNDLFGDVGDDGLASGEDELVSVHASRKPSRPAKKGSKKPAAKSAAKTAKPGKPVAAANGPRRDSRRG